MVCTCSRGTRQHHLRCVVRYIYRLSFLSAPSHPPPCSYSGGGERCDWACHRRQKTGHLSRTFESVGQLGTCDYVSSIIGFLRQPGRRAGVTYHKVSWAGVTYHKVSWAGRRAGVTYHKVSWAGRRAGVTYHKWCPGPDAGLGSPITIKWCPGPDAGLGSPITRCPGPDAGLEAGRSDQDFGTSP